MLKEPNVLKDKIVTTLKDTELYSKNFLNRTSNGTRSNTGNQQMGSYQI